MNRVNAQADIGSKDIFIGFESDALIAQGGLHGYKNSTKEFIFDQNSTSDVTFDFYVGLTRKDSKPYFQYADVILFDPTAT